MVHVNSLVCYVCLVLRNMIVHTPLEELQTSVSTSRWSLVTICVFTSHFGFNLMVYWFSYKWQTCYFQLDLMYAQYGIKNVSISASASLLSNHKDESLAAVTVEQLMANITALFHKDMLTQLTRPSAYNFIKIC